MNEERDVPVWTLIKVPALITLGITVLRLVGELQHWSPVLFNPKAGGGGALVGISWLPFIFGIYFAVKLLGLGFRPQGALRVFGWTLLAIAVVAASGGTLAAVHAGQSVQFVVMFIAFVIAAWIAYKGWPALGKTLIAYAFAARIPVALVMLVAMLGEWGTHYDVAPPNFAITNVWGKWFTIGFLPQLTLWIGITVIVGMLVGALAVAVAGRKAATPATA